ncbi:MAG TPA: clostripain-related cysteine peptidase [Verrucomicrobiota bacterium]|nr:clostripain-related cysteine peptidase [Verrucomicrobiota bacterium]HRZ35845.1 clostripain-related cysteine peptidase [Candidatus Paceibacterota bacterium]
MKANVVTAVGTLALLILPGCTPYITSLNPNTGPEGTQVTILGGRFGATVPENTVGFGAVVVPASDVSVVSQNTLNAKVPVGAVTGLVSVKTKNGTGYSKENFVVPGERSWTFMVYLDADNNLESAGLKDFLEMASVGSTAGVTVLVQMDRIAGGASGYNNWTGTRRFLISSGSTPASPPLQDMGELNMGNPNVLRDFVEWGITNYPADHYALAIWNHGDGWRMNREKAAQIAGMRRSGADERVVKAVATDDTDMDVLYMREVQTALTDARQRLEGRNATHVKIDLIGFDACLMGMVEVAYALRDVTNYLVASEETEPGDGWPYDTILTDLTGNPNMSPADLARRIVIRYGNAGYSGVTQAAYEMDKIDELAFAIDAFADKATSEWSVLKSARGAARQYHPWGSPSCWGTDIYGFADKVSATASSADLRNAANALKAAVTALVIEEYHTSPDMDGSHGVAIYFPPDQTSFNADPEHTGYQDSNTFMVVDFVQYHRWDNWLPTYYSNAP